TELTAKVTVNTTSLTDGMYKIKVNKNAVKDENNVYQEKEVIAGEFEINNVAPISPDMVPSTTNWTNQNVTVTITYSSDSAQKKYSVDNMATWLDYTGPITVSENKVVYAKGINALGTESTQSTLDITIIDKVSPVVALSTNGATVAKTASTTVNVNDLESGLNTLKYVWDTQNAVEPTSGWVNFSSGANITKSNVTGVYYLWIKSIDNAGNAKLYTSNSFILDNDKPTITLNGSSNISINLNDTYTEQGAVVTDNMDTQIQSKLIITGTVNTASAGNYQVKYNVTDQVGNIADEVIRVVTVLAPVDVTFNYTGSVQTWTVPLNSTYIIECWGAQGASNGGKGGYTKGSIYLTKDTILYLYVGQQGTSSAGFNSGTKGGGGASDVRLSGGAWNDTVGLRSRIMVAGGGGEMGGHDVGPSYGEGNFGGDAGGLSGSRGANSWYSSTTSYYSNGGSGAGQTSGGTGGGTANNRGNPGQNGTFGIGGAAGASTGQQYSTIGSGGGGGWYGGGGGASGGYMSGGIGGGGGGSSFISGYSGCNSVNSSGTHTGQPNHYSGYVFTNMIMQSAIKTGAGSIKISQ
ncbi:MAG: glycine-rich protein, partial [Clostridia bacterium]|nr:glycine-rich protein [Clostridia bacterium]